MNPVALAGKWVQSHPAGARACRGGGRSRLG